MKRTATQWRNRLDKLFSQAVRARGHCERCGRSQGVQLQTSHIYSRSYKEGRWFLLNAFCFCASCHRWWHNRPFEAVDFAREKLGEENTEYLSLKIKLSQQWSEQDYLETEDFLKEEIEHYDNKRNN